MILSIFIAFLICILSIIIAGSIIAMWIIYRKFTQSADCYKMLESIIVKIYENKEKIK